jgi:hypothetical protein
MKPRRCSHCGRFLGRYLIITPSGEGIRLACPPCGPKVDGGDIQRDGQRMLERESAWLRAAS